MNKIILHALLVGLMKLSSIFGSLLFVYFMTPGEYGEYVILLTLIGYLTVFSSLNFNQAYGRYIYEERKKLKENIFGGHIFLIIVLAFSIISFSSFLLIKNILNISGNLVFYAFVIAFTAIIETLFFQYCIYKDKLAQGIYFFLFRNLLTFLILFYLVYNKFSLEIIFLTEAILSFICMFFIINYLKLKFQFSHFFFTFKYSLKYSLPLLPYTVSLVILSQSDRVMINYFFDSATAGHYSYIYNFGILLSFLFGAIMNFANNEFYQLFNQFEIKEEFQVHQRKLMFKFLFIGIICVIISSIFYEFYIPISIKYLVGYLPIVFSCILVSSIWQIWARILGYHKRTIYISIASCISAILYVILLYLSFSFSLDYRIAYWLSLISYIIMTLIGLYFVGKFDIGLVAPFFYDYLWILVFVLISIVCLFYYKTGFLLYFIMLMSILKYKNTYLKF